ncbi:hypothetical protein [Streptomyces sp. NPDC054863]
MTRPTKPVQPFDQCLEQSFTRRRAARLPLPPRPAFYAPNALDTV